MTPSVDQEGILDFFAARRLWLAEDFDEEGASEKRDMEERMTTR
jgi:hypothetical protein